MSKLSGEVLTLPKMSGSVLMPKSLNGNVGAKTINIGEDGATFIPSVSADGVISWTNDKELPNPDPVNIKGNAGYTPQKGVDYFDGKDGSDATVTAANIKSALNYTPANQEEVNNLSKDIDNLNENKQPKGDYALKSDIPNVPVQSVNGKTGEVNLSAQDVVADPAGTAESKVSEHNISTAAHNDIRLLIEGLTTRLNAIANSDDTTLDQMAEVVAYIKSNRTLIESITTDKISVADIINNLTTNVPNKPLSAAQGVVLKGLIDALQTAVNGIKVPTKTSELTNDSGFLTQHQSLADYAKKTELPTKTSQLTNDSGFLTQHQDLSAYAKKTDIPSVPTKTSQLTNDSGFLTSVPTEYVTETELTGKGYAKQTDVNNLSNEIVHYITPEMYGAKGNGTTDDSAAIRRAIDEAGSDKIVYLAKKTYKISTGLEITHSNRTFICDGTLSYDGTGVAVLIGSKHINVDINRIDAVNGTAIKVDATPKYVNFNVIKVNYISNSKIGIHLYTNGYSLCYNHFYNKEIVASEKGIFVECDSSYMTENWWHLGRIYGNPSKGIHLKNTGRNVFCSGGIEGISDSGCAIYIENSEHNDFRGLRCSEYYGAKSIVFVGECTANIVELSRICLDEVDISALTLSSNADQFSNILRSPKLIDSQSTWNTLGNEAWVSYRRKITYNPNYKNFTVNANESTYPNRTIGQVGSDIPTTIVFDSTGIDGKTFKLSDIYNKDDSMVKGFPLTIKFGTNGGKVILNDSDNEIILDNTTGTYAGKIVSVKWNGVNPETNKDIWCVQTVGAVIPTNTSQLVNDSGFITADDIPQSQAPDLSAYSTTVQNDAKYQPKGNYLTSIPSEYVKQTEMEAYIDETFLGGAW